MSTPQRFFLLDGMALAYRAYFSFISRPLLNSKGENTSAIFGFVTTLLKILDEEKPASPASLQRNKHARWENPDRQSV